MNHSIHIFGDVGQGGTYLLQIHLRKEIELAFGRFQGGKMITLPAGDYLYVGSAMGTRGSTTLVARLLRHATRSGEKHAHILRDAMLATFLDLNLILASFHPPVAKKLYWHIDYLLDLLEAELAQVFAIRSSVRLESLLAGRLEADPGFTIVEKGLGARDARGESHLLRAIPGRAECQSLQVIMQFFGEENREV